MLKVIEVLYHADTVPVADAQAQVIQVLYHADTVPVADAQAHLWTCDTGLIPCGHCACSRCTGTLMDTAIQVLYHADTVPVADA